MSPVSIRNCFEHHRLRSPLGDRDSRTASIVRCKLTEDMLYYIITKVDIET